MRLYWPRMREGITRVPKPTTKCFNRHINNPSIHAGKRTTVILRPSQCMAVKETCKCAAQPIGPSDKDQHKDLQFGKSCEGGRERKDTTWEDDEMNVPMPPGKNQQLTKRNKIHAVDFISISRCVLQVVY